MVYLPKSYRFEDLEEPSWDYGPIWEPIAIGVFGLCGVIKTGTILNPLDLVAYLGDLFIVPAHPALGISIIDYFGYSKVRLIDREKWFEINRESHRMKKYSIPNIIRSPGVIA